MQYPKVEESGGARWRAFTFVVMICLIYLSLIGASAILSQACVRRESNTRVTVETGKSEQEPEHSFNDMSYGLQNHSNAIHLNMKSNPCIPFEYLCSHKVWVPFEKCLNVLRLPRLKTRLLIRIAIANR